MDGEFFEVRDTGCWGDRSLMKNQLVLLPSNFTLDCRDSPGKNTYLLLPESHTSPLLGNGASDSDGIFFLVNDGSIPPKISPVNPVLEKFIDSPTESIVDSFAPVEQLNSVGAKGNCWKLPQPPLVVSKPPQAPVVVNKPPGNTTNQEAGKTEVNPVLKTRSGRICRLSKKLKQNLDDVKPAVKVDKRKRVKCNKCEEVFIGVKSLWKHLVVHPDHGSLPDNGEELDKLLKPQEKVRAKPIPKEKNKVKKVAVEAVPNGEVQLSKGKDVEKLEIRKTEQIHKDVLGRTTVSSVVRIKDEPMEVDMSDVEAMKRAFLRKCQDLSLGELFVVRTELHPDEIEIVSSLSTPYGRRFLAMLKDLERLVDALKYAAELSFVLEESEMEDGVLKVDGTLSDILAIAEGYYKPVCDVKEIMQLVREKLKTDSEQHRSKFGLPQLQKPPEKPVEPPKPTKRRKVVKVQKRRKPVTKPPPLDLGPAPSMPPLSPDPSISHPPQHPALCTSHPLPSHTSPTSCTSLPQIPVTTAPASVAAAPPAPGGGIELTIDAVIHTVGESEHGAAPNVTLYCNDASFMPCGEESGRSRDAIQLPVFSEDSNMPTESLSPSLKVVDESVTKDALTILSEDMNETSNSSDIGCVLIPVSGKNGVSNFLPNGTQFDSCVNFDSIPGNQSVSMSMDDFLPPFPDLQNYSEKRKCPSRNSYSMTKAGTEKKPKQTNHKDDCATSSAASVFNGNKLIKESLCELGRQAGVMNHHHHIQDRENIFLSLDSNFDPVPVEIFDSDLFLNPNVLTHREDGGDVIHRRLDFEASSPKKFRGSRFVNPALSPRGYPVTRSPDRFAVLPNAHSLLSPRYRTTCASSGAACTIVDSGRKPVSPSISPRLFATSPLPSPVRGGSNTSNSHGSDISGLNSNGLCPGRIKDGDESELDDDDVDAHHGSGGGADSDVESANPCGGGGDSGGGDETSSRLTTRPTPDAVFSDSSNCSVVDFEKLMRDIDIPVDLNYVAVTSEFEPMALPSPSSFQTPPRDPVFH